MVIISEMALIFQVEDRGTINVDEVLRERGLDTYDGLSFSISEDAIERDNYYNYKIEVNDGIISFTRKDSSMMGSTDHVLNHY